MNIKTNTLIFWITTSIIFLFEGVMPLFFFQSEASKEGMSHLGYPAYFGIMLVVFKILGTLTLIIHKAPARIKEWAYAGFAIDFIAAGVSHWAVDGFGGQAIFPFVFLLILSASYVTYHKLFVKS
jgi:uncharacterized membrane protein YphA (DoxX/SURF4 family)